MNNKKVFRLTVFLLTFLLAVLLSGCSENIGSNGEVVFTEFLGTWIGNMNYSMSNFRDNFSMFNATNRTNREINFSSHITELEFTKDTVYMTISTENESQTIPNSYTVEGNQLILSFQFSDERPGGRPSFNGTEIPPFNGSELPPFNGSENPPINGERPPFDDRPIFDGERPSMKRFYNYSFNQDYTILYLDGYSFYKI